MKKIRKTLKSALAITLCASMILSSEITLTVLAVDKPDTEPDLIEELSDEGIEKHEKIILGEIENKRSQHEKHFKLKDGAMMAVQYAIPVHFTEDGEKWTEYDNRLDLVYENGKEVYKNRKSDINIKLSYISDDENMISIDKGNAKIGWGYADVGETVGMVVEKDETLAGNDRFTTLQNIISQINYENIYPDVDAEYYISSEGVKENLILKTEEAQRQFLVNYDIGKLSAKQTDEHTIMLTDGKNEIYNIKAPFMTDADGDISTDLSLSIKSLKDGQLSVIMKADDKFFDEDCNYPVVLDPTIYTLQSIIESTYVNEYRPNDFTGNGSYELTTGFHSGRCYSFIKMNSLPELNKGDTITDAKLRLNISSVKNNALEHTSYVNVHEVNGSDWSASTLCWNNMPTYSDTVSDYVKLSSGTTGGEYYWNITDITKKWYNTSANFTPGNNVGKNNFGIMLLNTGTGSDLDYINFSSHLVDNTNLVPTFLISYRNNKGLEDYWSYTNFNVGTAGTVYVNNYTGNLVFVHNDSSITGNNSFTLQHVFNNYMANEGGNSLPYVEKGWNLNVHQTITSTSNLGIDTDEYPYVYTDGDGTEHYFVKVVEQNEVHYYDEDGLGLELTVNPSDQLKISDVIGNCMSFDTNGYLSQIEDFNGNITTINCDNNGEIISVSTNNENNNSIKTISIIGDTTITSNDISDPSGRMTQYICNNDLLAEIKNPDNTIIQFNYDSDGSIVSIVDIDGYKVEFAYDTIFNGKRVTSIQEKGTDNTTGQKITFDYSQNNTTSVRTSGIDNIYGTNDDVISIYQFDYYGRAVSVKNTTNENSMNSSGCTYTAGEANLNASSDKDGFIKNLNRIKTQHYSSLGTYNYLQNGNMEKETGWISLSPNPTNVFQYSIDQNYYYYGKKSYKISSDASINSDTSDYCAGIYQDINNTVLQPGKKYNFSAYVKITDIHSSETKYGAQIAAIVTKSDNTTATYYSEMLNDVTNGSVDNGWRRLNVSFTLPQNTTSTKLVLYLKYATGTLYYDAVQLEDGDTFNRFNLLENASFEENLNIYPPIWSGNSLTVNDDRTNQNPQDRSYCFKFVADQNAEKSLTQDINISGFENDTYILSGWLKSNRIKSGIENVFGFDSSEMIIAQVHYSDGSALTKHIDMFNDCVSDWQYCSGSFDLSDGNPNYEKIPVKITITLRCAYQANDCYFDNIQLIKDSVKSYVYDNGNLIGYSENTEQTERMEYTDADLTKSIDAEDNETKYTYSDHNVTSVESETGVATKYEYDTYGNPITVKVQDNDETDEYEIKTDVDYTSDGLYVSQTTDEDGNAVSYVYNSDKGTLTSVTDSKGTTNYTYDNDTDLPLSASKNNITVTYGYTNGTKRNLTSVSNGYVSYALNYDKFNNLQQASVGSNTLATYTYGSNNGALDRLTYGNGDYIDFLYNDYGDTRVVKQNGNVAFRWFTDNSGNAVRHYDYIANREYDYFYDTAGRLVDETIKKKDNDSSDIPLAKINYAYDEIGRVSKMSNAAGNRTVTVDYTYLPDDLPATTKINNDKTKYFEYDSLNRLVSTRIDLDNDITASYTYKASDRNTGSSTVYQTNKIETETVGGITYKYTYDTVGNITGIYRQVNGYDYKLHIYTYDSFNQLTSDTDFTQLIRTDYSYDNHGNITSVSKSAVNYDGIISTSIGSTQYQYTDSTWADKLTSYNGQTITYDSIGNPLTYRNGMIMTWKNGRELATLENGNKTMTYKYDANGLRTVKTINNTVHRYEYVNNQLLYEYRGSTRNVHYIYDGFGNVTAAIYKPSNNEVAQVYYYAHNWRGDVVALYDSTGSLFATYDYDAWGKVLRVADANDNLITSTTNFANINPFRYRGYYYDTDSELYYLQSRYYDPTTGRFVNADSILCMGSNGSVIDFNLFLYCCNNSINNSDHNGYMSYKSWYTKSGKNYNIYTEISFWWTKITVKYQIKNNKVKFPFDNGNDYWGIFWRGGGKLLAEAIFKIVRQIDKKLLSGRSIGGINTELQLHYAAYVLGIKRSSSHVADIGGVNRGQIGYDDNAWFFETGNAMKIAARFYISPVWGLASTIRNIARYL